MRDRVLIVDDDPNTVLSLEFMMKREGFQVAVAPDAASALSQVASFHPDVLLLDTALPDRSGFEVCQFLRADPENADVRVVLLSGSQRASDLERGRAMGVDDVVVKPFSTRDLVSRVRTLLSGVPA